MSTHYQAVQWNAFKKRYDKLLVAGVAIYLFGYAGLTKLLFPAVTDEILIMRSLGSAAFILLNLVLCIGPLCRLDRRFLPLLYNRRHMGVTVFLLALGHAIVAVLTYHVGGVAHPLLSIFTSSPFSGPLAWIPFQPFGFFALLILFLMAATSHDFWLANLTAPVWKALHMLIYLAYALLAVHVVFGIIQAEQASIYLVLSSLALGIVPLMHLLAGFAGWRGDMDLSRSSDTVESFIDIGSVDDIFENRAKVVCLKGESIAVFKYDGKIAAVSNACRHQNGPLGEGRIVKGCITCPWHAYQYLPETGHSPPPFEERVPTFPVKVAGKRILVKPHPQLLDCPVQPALIAP